MGDLDLPFEEQQPTALGGDAEYVAGAVVMGAVVPLLDGNRPAVVFRFPKPDGSGYLPAVVLVGMEDHTLPNLVPLVQAAVEAAIEKARGL